MKAVRIHRMGAPEVLTYEDVPEPTLGPGQVLLDVKAIGVNYNDVLIRKGEGSHNADELPITLGREASGIVLEVGEGVTDISAGDLVAYRGVTGSYAERVAVPARLCVPVPEELGPEIGAGACSGGQTAHYLAFSTCPHESRRPHISPCRSRRHRPDAGADGQDGRGLRLRHRVHRGKGPHRQGRRGRPCHYLHRRGLRSRP